MSKESDARKERLKSRTRRGVKNRGKKGLGKKGMLDLSKGNPKSMVDDRVVLFKMECELGKHRLIDHLPYVITQDWYQDLREKSGEPTGLLVGDWDYKLEMPFHKLKGGGYILCLAQAFGKECAWCNELYSEWEKPKEEQDEDKCKSLYTTWRCAYNVYDYDAANHGEEGIDPEMIRLWDDQAYANYEDLLQQMMEVDIDGLVTFWDLEQGKTVKYKTKKKKFAGYPYDEVSDIEFVDRDNWDKSILDETHSLDQMATIPTEEDVVKALKVLLGDEEPDDPGKKQEKESPARQERSSRTSRDSRQPAKQEDESPFKDGECLPDECPAGHKFGTDTNNTDECNSCDEKKFEECSNEFARQNAMDKDPEPEKKKETEAPKRRRRSS